MDRWRGWLSGDGRRVGTQPRHLACIDLRRAAMRPALALARWPALPASRARVTRASGRADSVVACPDCTKRARRGRRRSEVDEVEFLTCLFWGGDGCRVSRGDGRNKSERLERRGSSPSVECTSCALAAGCPIMVQRACALGPAPARTLVSDTSRQVRGGTLESAHSGYIRTHWIEPPHFG